MSLHQGAVRRARAPGASLGCRRPGARSQSVGPSGRELEVGISRSGAQDPNQVGTRDQLGRRPGWAPGLFWVMNFNISDIISGPFHQVCPSDPTRSAPRTNQADARIRHEPSDTDHQTRTTRHEQSDTNQTRSRHDDGPSAQNVDRFCSRYFERSPCI